MPIQVVNYVDNEVNEFVNYSTKREPMEGVNLNLDPDFLCGCDCEDDCSVSVLFFETKLQRARRYFRFRTNLSVLAGS